MSDQQKCIGISLIGKDLTLINYAHSELSETVRRLGPHRFDHASVSMFDSPEEIEVVEEDTTYHDAETLVKVRDAIEALGYTRPQVENIIAAVNGVGILFREMNPPEKIIDFQ